MLEDCYTSRTGLRRAAQSTSTCRKSCEAWGACGKGCVAWRRRAEHGQSCRMQGRCVEHGRTHVKLWSVEKLHGVRAHAGRPMECNGDAWSVGAHGHGYGAQIRCSRCWHMVRAHGQGKGARMHAQGRMRACVCGHTHTCTCTSTHTGTQLLERGHLGSSFGQVGPKGYPNYGKP